MDFGLSSQGHLLRISLALQAATNALESNDRPCEISEETMQLAMKLIRVLDKTKLKLIRSEQYDLNKENRVSQSSHY